MLTVADLVLPTSSVDPSCLPLWCVAPRQDAEKESAHCNSWPPRPRWRKTWDVPGSPEVLRGGGRLAIEWVSLGGSTQLVGCRWVLVQNSLVLVALLPEYVRDAIFHALSRHLLQNCPTEIAGNIFGSSKLQRQRNRSTRAEFESTHAV